MLRENKGITLIALVITIIVLLILAGITLRGGNESVKTTRSNKLLTELDMVQHACLERYTEYKLTLNDALLVGESVSSAEYSEVRTLASKKGVTLPAEPEGTYYKLDPNSSAGKGALQSLGITNIEDVYIVNYSKGSVMNYTTQETPKVIEGASKYLYKDNTSN